MANLAFSMLLRKGQKNQFFWGSEGWERQEKGLFSSHDTHPLPGPDSPSEVNTDSSYATGPSSALAFLISLQVWALFWYFSFNCPSLQFLNMFFSLLSFSECFLCDHTGFLRCLPAFFFSRELYAIVTSTSHFSKLFKTTPVG